MLSKIIRAAVFKRANYRCEYCLSPMDFSYQSFEIDHIIPISKKGTDDEENLACACGGCNAFKHDKIQAKDSFDNFLAPLFNPRLMVWTEHFAWSNDYLEVIGLSKIGRATVNALKLNRQGLVNIRRILMLDNLHPPDEM